MTLKKGYLSKIAEVFNKCSNGPIGPITAKVKDSFECLKYLGYITLATPRPR